MKEYIHLSHEILPIFINHQSSILILGSFPSVKSREYGFFYMHPQNRFFLVLSKYFKEEEPKSVNDRKDFLKKHRIALYDVIEECDIVGSSDSSIKNAVPIDIKAIIKNYPNIKAIGINGKKAQSLFNKHLLKNIGDMKCFYLPSTSPANAKCKVDDLLDEYKNILLLCI